MQPSGLSSLIFVVIIGVWAAYFIQYWVRRREHLATARSVDQFSESLRILERRSLARTAPSENRAQGYAAVPAASTRPSLHARRPSSTALVEDVVAGPAPRPVAARPGPSRSRVPGLLLLVSLVALVGVAGAMALRPLPVWALVVPAAAFVVSFAWVRHQVQAASRARHEARRAAQRRWRPVPAQAGAEPRRARQVAQPARAVAVKPEQPAAETSPAPEASATAVEEVDDAPRGAEPYDLTAVEAQPALPVVAEPAEPFAAAHLLVDEDDIPLTWEPVPVPRPTYTMKARATRPAPPAADFVGDADTEYAASAEDQAERRAAGA